MAKIEARIDDCRARQAAITQARLEGAAAPESAAEFAGLATDLESLTRLWKDARTAAARLDPEQLMTNPGLVRNRAKLQSSVKNARAFLSIQQEFGSFSAYQWRFVEGRPQHNHYEALSEVPAQTALSQQFSKDLKQRGFAFLGPVVIYAHMQACGMVNDHLISCFRHSELAAGGTR